jgi:hypothetical protein
MATFSKNILSESVNGKAIKIAATGTPGTLIHTGPSSASIFHEVWIYATNTDTLGRKLTVQWGGTTSPDDSIELTIPPESGLVLVTPGFLIKGNTTPLTVRAFAAWTNVLTIHGYVNVIA